MVTTERKGLFRCYSRSRIFLREQNTTFSAYKIAFRSNVLNVIVRFANNWRNVRDKCCISISPALHNNLHRCKIDIYRTIPLATMLCNQFGIEESDCPELLCELSCLVFQRLHLTDCRSSRSFSQQGCNKTGGEGFFSLENRGLGGIVYSQA